MMIIKFQQTMVNLHHVQQIAFTEQNELVFTFATGNKKITYKHTGEAARAYNAIADAIAAGQMLVDISPSLWENLP